MQSYIGQASHMAMRERERATHACLHARVMSQNYKGVDNQIDVQELIILKQHYQGDMH